MSIHTCAILYNISCVCFSFRCKCTSDHTHAHIHTHAHPYAGSLCFKESSSFNENIFIIIELHFVVACHNTYKRTHTMLIDDARTSWHSHTHTHTHLFFLSLSLSGSYSISLSLSLSLCYSHSWQRLILLAWQRASKTALFICQQNIIMSFHSGTHIYRTTAHPGQPCQAAACCRQQNGLKNLSVAKHLRHVFNNVVYNVDFSPFSLPPLPPLDFRMDFHRMPFMGGPKKKQ